MSLFPVPVPRWRACLLALAAVSVTGSSLRAIDIDRYGNAHITPQDMQDSANAQSRADAANWQQRMKDTNEFQARMAESLDKWASELQAKVDAKKDAEREAQARELEAKRQKDALERTQAEYALDQRRRQEREDKYIVIIDGQFMTGKEARKQGFGGELLCNIY